MATIRMTMFSDVLGMNTNITILTPKRPKKKPEEMPVMFLLHGLYEDATDWAYKSQAALYADVFQMVFVCPEVQRSFYINMEYGLQYETYIQEELPAKLEEMFHFTCVREHTYVCGISMGGYGALKWALKKPEFFTGCAAFSSAVDLKQMASDNQVVFRREITGIAGARMEGLDGNDLYTLVKKADESAKKLPCYLACGTQDFTYSMNVDFVKQLEELGFDITFQTGEGSHDWMYWNDALKHALNFFVSKTSGDDL